MENKLWQCPLEVKRGMYEAMPDSWLGAVVNYYVGAPTYQEALAKAVATLQSQGMEFVDLSGGQVFQLDPSQWWEGHVVAEYAEYSDYFPSQAEIETLVLNGGVCHGPFAGWHKE
ncbi:MAG: hypothetical protein AAGE92_05710 [Cyanobacteria bacterium P01_G01_bin.4]